MSQSFPRTSTVPVMSARPAAETITDPDCWPAPSAWALTEPPSSRSPALELSSTRPIMPFATTDPERSSVPDCASSETSPPSPALPPFAFMVPAMARSVPAVNKISPALIEAGIGSRLKVVLGATVMLPVAV